MQGIAITETVNCITLSESRTLWEDKHVFAEEKKKYIQILEDERSEYIAIAEQLNNIGVQAVLAISPAVNDAMAHILKKPPLAAMGMPAAPAPAVVGPAVNVPAN